MYRYGEASHSAKLTPAQVLEIRQRYARDGATLSHRALAREYDVSRTAIRLVVQRKSWRYLDQDDEEPEPEPVESDLYLTEIPRTCGKCKQAWTLYIDRGDKWPAELGCLCGWRAPGFLPD